MRKSLSWFAVLMLVISFTAVLSLSGCKEEAAPETTAAAAETTAAAAGEGPFTIGMIVKNTGNPFFEKCKEGGQSVADEFGDTLIFQAPETATAEGQITLIDALIAQEVDGICISANDSTALVPKCQEAMDAGIKVISFDSGIDQDGRILHFNTADTELIGRGQVQMIAEMI